MTGSWSEHLAWRDDAELASSVCQRENTGPSLGDAEIVKEIGQLLSRDLLPKKRGPKGPRKKTKKRRTRRRRQFSIVIAVGAAVSGGPPHRSRHAELPHRAPMRGARKKEKNVSCRLDNELAHGSPRNYIGKARGSRGRISTQPISVEGENECVIIGALGVWRVFCVLFQHLYVDARRVTAVTAYTIRTLWGNE